ncbi:MAG TPA: GNAT family N-acetyltransferase [Devosiaceae bacterium]
MIGLRPARPEDAGAIRDLVRAVYAKWVPIIGREPAPMLADYEVAVREHLFALHEADGVLVALIEMQLEPNDLLIVNVAVAESAQGQGLGSALLAHAEDVARQHGRPSVRLYTNARMEANIALYRRRGYAEYSRDMVMGGATTRVNMRKILDQPV